MSEEVKSYMGRNVIEYKMFLNSGAFQSMHAAHTWLRERGYDYGSFCSILRMAVMKGDYRSYNLPLYWNYFTQEQIDSVHGVMAGGYRNGPVHIYIFEQ